MSSAQRAAQRAQLKGAGHVGICAAVGKREAKQGMAAAVATPKVATEGCCSYGF